MSEVGDILREFDGVDVLLAEEIKRLRAELAASKRIEAKLAELRAELAASKDEARRLVNDMFAKNGELNQEVDQLRRDNQAMKAGLAPYVAKLERDRAEKYHTGLTDGLKYALSVLWGDDPKQKCMDKISDYLNSHEAAWLKMQEKKP